MASLRLKITVISAIVLCGIVESATTQAWADPSDVTPLGPSNAKCQRNNYSVSVSSNNIRFKDDITSNDNQSVITQHFLEFITTRSNFTAQHEDGNLTVSGTYRISGVLCVPNVVKQNVNSSTIQLLLHGGSLDSTYWHPALPEEYSYVYHASDAGYATFRYDQLGAGLSEHPNDTLNVVQTATELAILSKIASMLRSGQIGNRNYSTIIGVGHSYGSVQLEGLAASQPSAIDSLVLTGFTANGTGSPLVFAGFTSSIATQTFPTRFRPGSLPNGYLVIGAPQAAQLVFWNFPYYLQAAFDLFWATTQPIAQGALFTTFTVLAPATAFTGPIRVVTGERDLVFCYSNCYAVPAGSGLTSKLDTVKALFPAVTQFSTQLVANSGHVITGHLSTAEAYREIQSYLLQTTT